MEKIRIDFDDILENNKIKLLSMMTFNICGRTKHTRNDLYLTLNIFIVELDSNSKSNPI